MTVKFTERPSYLGENTPAYYEVATRFSGVAIPKGASIEEASSEVFLFCRLYTMLDDADLEATSGHWDLHLGVRLIDGREEGHFGDGALCEIVPGANGPNMRITVWDDPDESFDDYPAFKEFRRDSVGSDAAIYEIPVRLISELGFGWCT